jgi:hypothetical protein
VNVSKEKPRHFTMIGYDVYRNLVLLRQLWTTWFHRYTEAYCPV